MFLNKITAITTKFVQSKLCLVRIVIFEITKNNDYVTFLILIFNFFLQFSFLFNYLIINKCRCTLSSMKLKLFFKLWLEFLIVKCTHIVYKLYVVKKNKNIPKQKMLLPLGSISLLNSFSVKQCSNNFSVPINL